jgi:hypothetical protein
MFSTRGPRTPLDSHCLHCILPAPVPPPPPRVPRPPGRALSTVCAKPDPPPRPVSYPFFPSPASTRSHWPPRLREADKDPPPPTFESNRVLKLLPTPLSMSPVTVATPPRRSPPRTHCHRPFTVRPSSHTFSHQSDRCLTPTSPSSSSRYTLKPLSVAGAACRR